MVLCAFELLYEQANLILISKKVHTLEHEHTAFTENHLGFLFSAHCLFNNTIKFAQIHGLSQQKLSCAIFFSGSSGLFQFCKFGSSLHFQSHSLKVRFVSAGAVHSRSKILNEI